VPVAMEVVGQPGSVRFLDLSDATDQPGVRVHDTAVIEGDEGFTEAVFRMSLFPVADEPVVVTYSIEGLTASAGSDFVAQGVHGSTALLQFDPGATSRTIAVKVVGDDETEPNETFRVVLSGASGAPIARAEATGTILDDDAEVPTLSIADCHVVEGDDASITVSLLPAAGTQVIVAYTTVSGPATVGGDFVWNSGTLVFAPGETERSIQIAIVDDDDEEFIESFSVQLTSASNAQIGNGEASVTILDDDGAGAVVGRETITGEAVTVQLESFLDDPVVILGSPTDHDPAVVVATVDQVTGSSFDLRLRGASGSGISRQEEIAYLALEPGIHVMQDGSIWEAGVFEMDQDGSWMAQTFTAPFPGTPALFLTIQNGSDDPLSAARARGVSAGGFEAALFGWSSAVGGAGHQVGYLAIHSGEGSGVIQVGETLLPYLLQDATVDQRKTQVLSWTLRLQRPSASPARQGRSLAGRRNVRPSLHAESLSVLALGNHVFAQDVEAAHPGPLSPRMTLPEHDAALEWGTATAIGNLWTTIPLARDYLSPVVVVKPVLNPGVEPVSMALRNVTNDSFEVRTESWSVTNASEIRVAYLVAEEGGHSLAGLRVLAGTVWTDARLGVSWDVVPFTGSFEQVPVVLAGLQTDPDDAGMLVRIHNRNTAWFDLSLQPGPLSVGTASDVQQVGWIAIEAGSTVTADGRQVLAQTEILTAGTPVDLRASRGRPGRISSPASVTIGDTGSSYSTAACFVCFSDSGAYPDAFLLVAGPSGSDSRIAEDGCFFRVK
jgi:hypothetical protein